MLPASERRNYRNVFDAFRRIPAEEGVTGLWKGGVATCARGMCLNLAMFCTYEEAKERMGKMFAEDCEKCQSFAWVMASFLAGSAAATASLPFDNAKTKM